MQRYKIILRSWIILSFILIFSVGTKVESKASGDIEAGKKIYQKRCMPCHGKNGKGNGPASLYIDPRPRDFTRGLFKLVSTESGLPSDDDIFKVITNGMTGTSMPGWEGIIPPEKRREVISYIKTFSSKFASGNAPTPIDMGEQVTSSNDSIEKGKELYNENCDRCHGINGRGNGKEAIRKRKRGKFKDKWGNPLWPRNLTAGWQYKGGYTPKDIYTRISTGIPGTPMPAFDDLESEERWHIANYVNSIVRDGKLKGDVVLSSKYVKEELPIDPNASIWSSAPSIYIPLSGQIMVHPRLINHSVDMVKLRSVFNDNEVAFLLEWDDRTKDVVHNPSGPAVLPGDKHKTTYPVLYPPKLRPVDKLRDEAVIQFPVKIPEGPKKPFFFLGNAGSPVNLWSFKADWQEDKSKKSPIEELKAVGYKALPTAHPDKSQTVEGQGVFDDGKWKVVMKRTLTSEDSSNDIIFDRGKLIPISIQILDGYNGERGLQRAISSWYYIQLEAAVSMDIYVKIFVGILLAIFLQIWLIKKARSNKEI